MNTAPPPSPAPPSSGERNAGATARKWAALNEAGGMVASLAGMHNIPLPGQNGELTPDFSSLSGMRRDLVENGVDDLLAMMEPGIAALLAVRAQGADPAPAAETLWQEFCAARNAILALMPDA